MRIFSACQPISIALISIRISGVIVLGIDPGLATIGYGLISGDSGRVMYIDHGVISSPADISIGERLAHIYSEIEAVIACHRPQAAGVEALYFRRNISSALPVAQATGVLLLALSRQGVATAEYAPPTIKQAISGAGGADKLQVQELVRILLRLPELPRPSHAADALATAICHFSVLQAQQRIASGVARSAGRSMSNSHV